MTGNVLLAIAVSDSCGTPPQLIGALLLVSTALGLRVNAAEVRRGELCIGEPGSGSLGSSIAGMAAVCTAGSVANELQNAVACCFMDLFTDVSYMY